MELLREAAVTAIWQDDPAVASLYLAKVKTFARPHNDWQVDLLLRLLYRLRALRYDEEEECIWPDNAAVKKWAALLPDIFAMGLRLAPDSIANNAQDQLDSLVNEIEIPDPAILHLLEKWISSQNCLVYILLPSFSSNG